MTVATSPVNMKERADLGIKAGDTVRVWNKIEERGKTRLQAFEGLVLARKHGNEAGGTFTVRKTASGVGVERIFPLYSPLIDKIEIVKRSKVRRSKLYYIRDKVSREMKRALRRMNIMNLSTEGEQERNAREAAVAAKEEEARKAAEEAEAAKKASEEKVETAPEAATQEAAEVVTEEGSDDAAKKE